MFGKLNKNVGFSLMPLAFVFLFEPNYGLIDLFPDFIGYAILCYAISNLADINPKLRESFIGFKHAALMGILRFIAIIVINKVFFDSERTVGTLLFVFIFAIFDIMILLPAYKSLFDGLLHLGIFHDGIAVYQTKEKSIRKYDKKSKSYITVIKKGRINKTEAVYALSTALVIAKAVISTLPELTTLASNSYYEFIIMLRAISIVILLPLGFAWLVKMIKYCKSVANDKPFIESLSNKFVEHARQYPQFYTVRTIITGLSHMCFAFVLSIDLYSNGVNHLPDYYFYILMIIAVVFLSKYSKKWKLPAIASLVGIPLSVCHDVAEKSFAANYDFSMIAKDINAYNAYYTVFYLRIADSVAFAVTLGLIFVFLWDIYKAHSEIVRLESGREAKNAKKAYIVRSVTAIAFGILALISGVFYVFAQPYYYDAWYYSYSLMISMLFQIIFIFVAVGFTGFVSNSVKYRYRMDL